MSNLTYYCTCCNAASGRSRRDIKEIGFNLRKPFWDNLFDCVIAYVQDTQSKAAPQELVDLSTELSSDPIFCYLSSEDIRSLFPGKKDNTTNYAGEMIVTYKWFKERTLAAWKRLRKPGSMIPVFLVEDFPGHDEVMYRGTFQLTYYNVQGVLVPKEIRLFGDTDADATRVSSSLRRCACGRPLSHFTGTAKEIVIAMQGSSRAGKTTTMIAIEYLLNNTIISPHSAISIESKLQGLDPDDEALIWVSKQHRNYGEGRTVVKTKKDTKTEHLIYSFRLNVNGATYILTMVDMAGEIFDEKEVLSDEWLVGYRAIYTICDAVWTFIPYQTLADVKLDWPFLLRHRRYYESQGENAEKTYRDELNTWNQVVKNGSGSYPDYEEFLEDVVQKTASPNKLLDKYACVHEARFLEELGETKEVLRYATPELYRNRLATIASMVWDDLENRPPHAVILTKSDSLIPLFLERSEGKKLADWYIYRDGSNDTIMSYRTPSGILYRNQMKPHFLPGGSDHLLVETNSGHLAVDEAVMNRICRNVHKFFRDQNPHSLSNFELLNPKQTCEFSLSAYGSRPVKDTDDSRPPKPYHVLVPLLWTLAVANILPVSYVQTDIRSRTAEEVKKMGTGRVVTERRVSSLASSNDTVRDNLYCVNDTYHYHENHSCD